MSTDFPSHQRRSDVPYVCVHCGFPSESLYHQLGASLSSIKVLTCTKCNEVIDPYIEREWLHIAIDCILMRKAAYRHVLYNSDAFQEISNRQRIQVIFALSCLDAYLGFESFKIDMGESPPLLQSKGFLFTVSMDLFVGKLVVWLAISMYGRLQCKNTSDSKDDSISDRFFLALSLPRLFTLVTILVMMWENTETVRLLESLMITSWQLLAVSVVSGNLMGPGVGLATGFLWNAALPSIIDLPCIGRACHPVVAEIVEIVEPLGLAPTRAGEVLI